MQWVSTIVYIFAVRFLGFTGLSVIRTFSLVVYSVFLLQLFTKCTDILECRLVSNIIYEGKNEVGVT